MGIIWEKADYLIRTIIHHSIRNCMYTYSDSPSLWGTEQSTGIWVGRRNRRRLPEEDKGKMRKKKE